MLELPCVAQEVNEPATMMIIKDEDGNYISSLAFDSEIDQNFAFRIALDQEGFESRIEFVECREPTCCGNMKKSVRTYEIHSPNLNSDMYIVYQMRSVYCTSCYTIFEQTEIGSYTHSHPSV